ncbi:MAG TPA: tyrosine-protein phosphatase [Thermoanaerobaculia bacterium]|nr:tyrosine-protein phosphatase [Thermoanaerobaculia bacterium]
MRHAIALAVLFALAACRSAQPLACDANVAPHAPRNFGEVTKNLYRGGQPTTCAELAYLHDLGIRSIVKLNDANSPLDASEKTEAQRMGFEVVSRPFDARTIGRSDTCDDVADVLAFLIASESPVFVHCTAGKDRTGYIVGLYEKLVLKKSVAAVMEELHRFGHRGARSATMPQIDRELRKEVPECSRRLQAARPTAGR